MSIYYFYLSLLLLMFIMIYYGISYSFKFAPLKIKVLSLAALIILSFRYIALIVLLITKNIKNLYMLKYFVFLNLLCLPILAIIAIYILARNDKIKFNYCLTIDVLFLVIYAIVIIKFSINIQAFGNLGYIMSFDSKNMEYGFYTIINTIFFFQGVMLIGNKTSNKLGMWLVSASAFLVVFEVLIRSVGFTLLPSVLIGEIMWMGTITYALHKFKK